MIDPEGVEPSPSTPRGRTRRAGPQAVRERRRGLVTWGLSIVLGILLINAVVGDNGYFATVAARREQQQQMAELRRLRLENLDLQERRHRLETDPSAVEDAAREQLNFIKPGETLIILQPAAAEPLAR